MIDLKYENEVGKLGNWEYVERTTRDSEIDGFKLKI